MLEFACFVWLSGGLSCRQIVQFEFRFRFYSGILIVLCIQKLPFLVLLEKWWAFCLVMHVHDDSASSIRPKRIW